MNTDTPRLIAKAQGLKRYIGQPCMYGHNGERYARNNACIKCHAKQKNLAAIEKRRARGLQKTGRKRKYPELIGPPRPIKKHPARPVTEFDFWVRRNRGQRTARTKLSVGYYKTLFVTHCPLLGLELTYKKGDNTTPKNYATLDRIDSSKGYEEGNVQILSYRANTLKNDATIEEMRMMLTNWEKQVQLLHCNIT